MADQANYIWDDLLKAFAGSDQADGVPKRANVTGSPWIQAHYLITDKQSENEKRKRNDGLHKGDAGYDMWAEWVYVMSGTAYSTILGVTCNWPFWDGNPGDTTPTPWGLFNSGPDKILGPSISGSCSGNDSTAPSTMWDAAAAIYTADNFFADERVVVNKWYTDLGEPDSEFQGSAAGRFREVLYGLENEFIQMHYGLSHDVNAYQSPPKPATRTQPAPGSKDKYPDNPVANTLHKAGDALRDELTYMYNNGFKVWTGDKNTLVTQSGDNAKGEHWKYTGADGLTSSYSNPYACVHYAFTELVKDLSAVLTSITGSCSATVSGAGISLVSSKNGAADSAGLDAFVAKLDAKAKEKWTQWVVATLDSAATTAGRKLTDAYDAAADLLMPIPKVDLNLPKDKVKTPDGKDDKGDGSKTDVKGPPGIGGTGGTGGGTGGGKGGIGGIGGIGGGDTSGKVPLLDKDGKPLLDKDGKPQMVPAGTHVNDKGQLVDKDGKPLLDKDGKPWTVPPGTVVGQPGPGGSSGGTGSTGGTGSATPFKVPPGSKRNDDGTVTAPDGTLVKDSNGNPVVLGKDRTIAEDGTVRDANGRPVSRLEQLLTDQEHALASGTGGGGWNPSIGGSGVSFGSGGSGGAGADLFGGRSGGASSGPRTVGGVASGPAGLGIGGQLASTLGVRPTVEAAAEAAAQEAQLTGRGISTTGGMTGPMMPPMGAGAGAGMAGQGEKDRQRTTWLSEDEEVWGTDSGAVTGVIGR
ncbi:hypothetical protein [Kitasatospora terrestris]|uniref:Uncharacterized protein n=1 Tax=Kitasatospora terrestris TaxID=258051 RepID=A0ABP9EU88_9ACTN